MKQFVKKEEQPIVFLLLLGAIFFFGYTFLYWTLPSNVLFPIESDQPAPLILNQPDETANYTFIRTLVFEGTVGYVEPLATESASQVHPRSTTMLGERVVPIGFPGVIFVIGMIVRFLVSIFGETGFHVLLLIVVPFFAAITPVIFYRTLLSVFEKKIAFISSLLLFLLPPWWYYASRPLQHSILFTAALIFGFFLLSKALEEKKKYTAWFAFLYACFMAGALYIRPSEVLWVVVVNAVVLFFARKRLSLWFFAPVIAGIVLVAAAFFQTQNLVYGHPFGTGYIKPLADGTSASFLSGSEETSFLSALIAPFGVHPKAIMQNAYAYSLKLFPAWAVLAFVGMILTWQRREKRANMLTRIRENVRRFISRLKGREDSWFAHDVVGHRYLLTFFIMTFFLLLFYGSWSFFDNLSSVASIGSSHARYFLPLYIASLPFVAIALSWLYSSTEKLVRGMLWLIVFVLSAQSIHSVFFAFEGLTHIRNTTDQYYRWQQDLAEYIPVDSIVVTRFGDKYVFPHWDVIPGLYEPEQFEAVKRLEERGFDVYFFDLALGDGVGPMKSQLREYNLLLSDPIHEFADLEIRRFDYIP